MWSSIDRCNLSIVLNGASSKQCFVVKSDRPDPERGIPDKWDKIAHKKICSKIKSSVNWSVQISGVQISETPLYIILSSTMFSVNQKLCTGIYLVLQPYIHFIFINAYSGCFFVSRDPYVQITSFSMNLFLLYATLVTVISMNTTTEYDTHRESN